MCIRDRDILRILDIQIFCFLFRFDFIRCRDDDDDDDDDEDATAADDAAPERPDSSDSKAR